MIRFEKVSFEQFIAGCNSVGIEAEESILKSIYDNIKLPKRATVDSAGYDFFMPFSTIVPINELDASVSTENTEDNASKTELDFKYNYITIPTGIRWVTDRDDVVLLMFPRSGLGFKSGLRLRNSTGVIDAGYCNSDNEGHIFAKFNAEDAIKLEVGKAFLQGVIVPFLKTDDDNATEIRNGGFGSTDKK